MELVVLFDGVCNLCNESVNFIIDHNSKNNIRFAALQSRYGQELIQKFELSVVPDSLVLLQEDKLYFKSDAALKVAKQLNAPYRAMSFFAFLPSSLRDAIYDWIASNRYRWFGKRDQCRMPDPTLMDRFINSEIVS